MTAEVLQIVVIYAFMLWIAIARIKDGRKILQDEIFTFSKKVDPTNLFSKYEKITLRGEAARLIGLESIVVGSVILSLVIFNLTFRMIDVGILFAIVLFGTATSGAFVYSKGYAMYKEEHNNR